MLGFFPPAYEMSCAVTGVDLPPEVVDDKQHLVSTFPSEHHVTLSSRGCAAVQRGVEEVQVDKGSRNI